MGVRVAGGLQVDCPHCGGCVEAPALRLDLVGFEGGRELLMVNPLGDLDDIVDDVRRAVVGRALEECGGVKKDAARRVGMKYSTFHDLVRRLGLDNADG